jgi:hypothetical protein
MVKQTGSTATALRVPNRPAWINGEPLLAECG